MRRRTLLTSVALALAGTATAAAVPAAGAAPAGRTGAAAVTRAGLKPIHGVAAAAASAKGKGKGSLLSLHTSDTVGAVSPHPQVYLVFWGSQWSSDPAGAAPALEALFSSLHGSADTWGTILDQYCAGLKKGTTNCGGQGIPIVHPTSSILAGVWFDNSAAEPTNATAAQIAAEAVNAADHFGNTTQALNDDAQYVVASPTGTHPDGFPNTGFCGYHDSTTASFGRIAFTNLPYVPDLGAGACTTIPGARLIDGYESTETHEYAESVTDLWPSRGWLSGGQEIGDLCIQLDAYLTIGSNTFDVQGLWSNAARGCVTTG
jgi:serine protease